MNAEHIRALEIPDRDKQRSSKRLWFIFLSVLAVLVGALLLARPWNPETRRVWSASFSGSNTTEAAAGATGKPHTDTNASPQANDAAHRRKDSILTVSGYIVNRERIELSPRFMGTVKWIGVKKGDAVTNGQVVVLLDDAECRARIKEGQGRLAGSRAALEKSELDFRRVTQLSREKIASDETADHARLAVEAARATLMEVEGQLALMQTYLDWTVIRSPINGVVLEKLVDPAELVTPQSFGGTRGPSTALIALADPNDLQVEIELNESDVAKAFFNQQCLVSPEAYPDRLYQGYVAEMAPEANRQKGTLQLKVQILDPDRFLTPELSARVDFFKEERRSAR